MDFQRLMNSHQIVIFLRFTLYRAIRGPNGHFEASGGRYCLELRAQKLSPRCVHSTMDRMLGTRSPHVFGHISLPFICVSEAGALTHEKGGPSARFLLEFHAHGAACVVNNQFTVTSESVICCAGSRRKVISVAVPSRVRRGWLGPIWANCSQTFAHW